MSKGVMQRLHDSEINCSVSCFWDSCWTAKIGDDMNGYKAVNAGLESFAEAEAWLVEEALKLYPDSTFAKSLHPPGG